MSYLKAKAQERPDDYLNDCLSAGVMSGDWLVLSEPEYERLCKKYRRGLGDKVERVLAPLVAWSDANLGTNLRGCKGCKRRKEKLNRLRI